MTPEGLATIRKRYSSEGIIFTSETIRFAYAARTDIPALIATVEAAWAEIDKLRDALLYFIQCENDGLEDDDLAAFSEKARIAIDPLKAVRS